MPRLVIRRVVFDSRNRNHATARASEQQLREVLEGVTVARNNRKGRTANFQVTGTARDGTRWVVSFNYDEKQQSARPITAWRAK